MGVSIVPGLITLTRINVCSFLDEELGGSQSHSRGASRDDGDFVL